MLGIAALFHLGLAALLMLGLSALLNLGLAELLMLVEDKVVEAVVMLVEDKVVEAVVWTKRHQSFLDRALVSHLVHDLVISVVYV